MSAASLNDFISLVIAAADAGALTRLVLSRPQEGTAQKISGRL